ncbi:MAG: hypothetical protein WCT04_06255 [Planctomycetota bacterium]
MPVVRHKVHIDSETDPKKLKILRRIIVEGGVRTGVAWSIHGDDLCETVSESRSKIVAFETDFTIQSFAKFCSILEAWDRTKTLFGGRETVIAYSIPNKSHAIYLAPGSAVPMSYPLDKMDPHYHVPRAQFESMKSEPLISVPCAFLTGGRRWLNALGHAVGESYHWGSGEVLWDRSNLLWLFTYRLRDEQCQRLWNYSLNIHNLGSEGRSISGLDIDRHDAAFLMAVQSARNGGNSYA